MNLLRRARESTGLRIFLVPFVAALLARALLVCVVVEKESCSVEEYTNSADGYQVKAVSRAWSGDLEAVREQVFYQILIASGGRGSSHLLRLYPVPAAIPAIGRSLGLPDDFASTLPFWLLAATAAGLGALWARDVRVGLLVGFLPPISIYTTTFLNGTGWLLTFAIAGLMLVRADRPVVGGLAFGISAWSRPEGLFPAVGALVALASRGRRGDALRLGGATALAQALLVILTLARFHPLLKEIFGSPRTATSATPSFLDLPGRALWQSIASPTTPTWKLAYVGLHLLAAIASLALLARRTRRCVPGKERSELVLLGVWLALQLGLTLCLRGGQGFDDLPRYLGLAAPAMIAALLPALPKMRWAIPPICAASLVVAVLPALKNAAPECGGGAVERTGRESGATPRPPPETTPSPPAEMLLDRFLAIQYRECSSAGPARTSTARARAVARRVDWLAGPDRELSAPPLPTSRSAGRALGSGPTGARTPATLL